jgi:hypothetical protein
LRGELRQDKVFKRKIRPSSPKAKKIETWKLENKGSKRRTKDGRKKKKQKEKNQGQPYGNENNRMII